MKLTNIEWTHSTINGSSGCDGCELWNDRTRTCYAGQVHENRLAPSYPDNYASAFDEVRMIPGRFAQAASWGPPTSKENQNKPWFIGKPRHIFVGDMGDFLSEAVTDDFLERELLASVRSKTGSRHVWQFLSKRPGRMALLSESWGGLPPNVFPMTTATSQRTAEVRIPDLLRVRCNAVGLSCEPLLTPLDLSPWLRSGKIKQVIVGGESGIGCRPMNPDWVRSLRDQCGEHSVCFFFKQWGGFRKRDTGRLLDGRTYDEVPIL
jgi:protein gp37